MTLLVLGILVLGGVIAVLVPILTHQSTGGSGQELPEGYVSESSAEGSDGRTRTLSVENAVGERAALDDLVPGEQLVITGVGFDTGIGIYVAICAIPAAVGEKPSPCLGGAQSGATDDATQDGSLPSAWITNDWAWQAFASDRYADTDSGTFTVTITVPEPAGEGLDCRETQCAIATRADHTAGADRVQDMLLPVRYAVAPDSAGSADSAEE